MSVAQAVLGHCSHAPDQVMNTFPLLLQEVSSRKVPRETDFFDNLFGIRCLVVTVPIEYSV